MYASRCAPHVTGVYDDRDEDGRQLIVWTCTACGETGKRTCDSGQPRKWIDRAGLAHWHCGRKTK